MAIINHCEDSQDVVIPFNIVVPANGCRPQPEVLYDILLSKCTGIHGLKWILCQARNGKADRFAVLTMPLPYRSNHQRKLLIKKALK
jgi:hypothetical protein